MVIVGVENIRTLSHDAGKHEEKSYRQKHAKEKGDNHNCVGKGGVLLLFFRGLALGNALCLSLFASCLCLLVLFIKAECIGRCTEGLVAQLKHLDHINHTAYYRQV